MKEIRLFTPGPTPVPQAVREAESLPMIHHRSKEFADILGSVRRKLKWLCDADGEALVLASSGSGGMEASVASLFSPGDEVIVVEGGKFGERWVELAKHYHLKGDIITVEWGKAVDPEEIRKRLTPATRGVFVQACESSTGVYHPIPAIGKALAGRNDCLLVVDAITALGIHDLSMARDRIDVLIGASQKALMSPPGLATVALSQRAEDRLGKTSSQGYYFSLQKEWKMQPKGQTGFTPAISIVRAVDVALGMIEKEGKEALFSRQRAMQKMAREAFRKMRINLVNSDADATWGITAAWAPEGKELKAWLTGLKESQGLWLAGGQGKFEGRIFRLSHMGYCSESDLRWALETIEGSLK